MLDFDYEHINAGIYADPGFPVRDLDGLDRDSFYGETTDRFDRSSEIASVRLTAGLGGRWIARAAAQTATTEREARLIVFGGVDETTGDVGRLGFAFDQRFEVDMVQTDLRGAFNTGPVRHDLLISADYQRFGLETPSFGRTAFTPVPLIDATQTGDEFVSGPARPPVETSNYGIAVQDRIELGALALLAGLRLDVAQSEEESDTVLSPSGSLVYSLRPDLNLYATYAQSFEPNNGVLIAPGEQAPHPRPN